MKKNILIFSSTFPKSASDTETPRFVFELARELVKDFNVFALAPDAPDTKRSETIEGVQVIRFPYFPKHLQSLAYGTGMTNNLRDHPLSRLQVPCFMAAGWRALGKAVRRHNIHLVNSHWMVPQGLIGALRCKALGTKHVLTIHSAGLFALKRWPMGQCLAQRIVKGSDEIFCVSKNNHRELEKLVGETVPLRIQPMGIDTAFFKTPGQTPDYMQGKKNILYVGKLSPIKGVQYLLEAFGLIKDIFPETQLVLVGSGIMEQQLREQVETTGLSSRVVFAGQQGKASVRDHLHASEVLVVPSVKDKNGQVEGFPVVMMEALAAGVPVVGTRAGGTPEGIIEGRNGFIVNPADPSGLAEKITNCLNTGQESFSDAAMASAEQFDWSAVANNYRETFQRLLD